MQIMKRNGVKVEFDANKISKAIQKAMKETSAGIDEELADKIAKDAEDFFTKNGKTPSVEDASDMAEELLAIEGRFDAAKRFILYREERSNLRHVPSNYQYLSNEFLKPYRAKKDSFESELGRMVYKRTYSRPIPLENRREDWWETVARVVDFSTSLEVQALQRNGVQITEAKRVELEETAERMYDHMFNLGLFPSGRSLWVGGTESSYKYPLSNFNCSFVTMDSFEKFSEMFFVLMLGTGVGLSVERKYIQKMPKIRTDVQVIHKDYTPVASKDRLEFTELTQTADNILTLNIGDSKFGWSKSMEMFLEILTDRQYDEIDAIIMNYDNVRPKGEPLKTFGGYASGHGNLKAMFEKINAILKKKTPRWSTMKPIDALDFATIIAENVVSGGVRRSALIVFADADEREVVEAKANLYSQNEDGSWGENKEIIHRALSNNTLKYYEHPGKPAIKSHIEELRLNGEPGFLNMEAALKRRDDAEGGNPCMEIILVDRGVCNLTEINMANYVDEYGNFDYAGLYEAQRLSAIIGYRMATIELEIHKWNLVNEEDMLVGCSLTGMTDFMQKAKLTREEMRPILNKLRDIAHEVTSEMAEDLGRNAPKLVTTIKPSGTVSQLPTVSSGLHYNHSAFYIRRVRVSAEDPIALAMVDMGFEWHPENGETIENHRNKVFAFPVKAPGTVFKGDIGAIDQLEWYKLIMEEYVDHNASITVHVRDEEWDDVVDWLDENWDDVVGVSFLPYDGGVYALAPYEKINKEQYEKMLSETPIFNTKLINKYEKFDEEFDILDSSCDTGFCPIR